MFYKQLSNGYKPISSKKNIKYQNIPVLTRNRKLLTAAKDILPLNFNKPLVLLTSGKQRLLFFPAVQFNDSLEMLTLKSYQVVLCQKTTVLANLVVVVLKC